MQINWFILAGAAVLLFVPASWIYPASARERLASWHSARFRLEAMLGTWQHWLDLARAFGGTFLLVNAAVLVEPMIAEKSDRYLALLLTWGTLALGVFFQTAHRKGTFYFTAPVFFLWGATLALVDWVPALFAIVFSAALARMLNHVELKLPMMAGLLGVVGYLVSGLSLTLILTAGLIVFPMVIAFACMSHLVCYTRDLAET